MTSQSRCPCCYANDRWRNWGTDKVSNFPKVKYLINDRAGTQACFAWYSVLCPLLVILISESTHQIRVSPTHRCCRYKLLYAWWCQKEVVASMDPTVQVGRLERPPVAQRLFQDRELTEKKRGLNSALSLPSWDPGDTPKERRGGLVGICVPLRRWHGQVGRAVNRLVEALGGFQWRKGPRKWNLEEATSLPWWQNPTEFWSPGTHILETAPHPAHLTRDAQQSNRWSRHFPAFWGSGLRRAKSENLISRCRHWLSPYF